MTTDGTRNAASLPTPVDTSDADGTIRLPAAERTIKDLAALDADASGGMPELDPKDLVLADETQIVPALAEQQLLMQPPPPPPPTSLGQPSSIAPLALDLHTAPISTEPRRPTQDSILFIARPVSPRDARVGYIAACAAGGVALIGAIAVVVLLGRSAATATPTIDARPARIAHAVEPTGIRALDVTTAPADAPAKATAAAGAGSIVAACGRRDVRTAKGNTRVVDVPCGGKTAF